MPIVPLILISAIAGVIIWVTVSQARQSEANMRALAQRLGWEYRPEKTGGLSGPQLMSSLHAITGQQQGRGVRFYLATTGGSKNQSTWRTVGVSPNPAGRLTFFLHRQDLGAKIESLLGAKEATVGDAAFDAAWFLQTNDPDFLGAALVPAVRAKLMTALAAGGSGLSFKLDQGMVRYAERGTFGSAAGVARLEQMLPVLQDLADIAEVAAARNPAAAN